MIGFPAGDGTVMSAHGGIHDFNLLHERKATPNDQ